MAEKVKKGVNVIMSFGQDVAYVLDIIRKDRIIYKDYVSQEAIKAAGKMVSVVKEFDEDTRKSIVQLVKQELTFQYPYVSVWWYSVLLEMQKDVCIYKDFISFVRKNSDSFSPNTQYFLFYQLVALGFEFSELTNNDIRIELWKFFQDIVESFAKMISVPLSMVPEDRRNHNKVIVITEQLLRTAHGPTKTALDRCKVIMTALGKEVVLINTAEIFSSVGAIPFYRVSLGSYVNDFLSLREQEWKGVKIPYVQCEKDMPEKKTLELLLKEIRNISPEYVVEIGGKSILANLINRMFPVLCVGLSPSEMEYSTAKYQLLGRKINAEDESILKQVGISKERIIESVFSSSLKEQSQHISRKDLGISENDFLMIVVGFRLDEEVTTEFLQMLDDIIEPDMHVVFLGRFNSYEASMDWFSKLKGRSSYLGFADDILSRLEVCDLYVGPRRTGGGTSVVEAMFKGLPVVVLNYGDMAVNAGEEFCVNDYKDMQKKILEYYANPEYYKEMSQKAIKRAEQLLDSETEFVKAIKEMEQREGICKGE